MNVSTSKCEKNLDFIFKKIGMLEQQIAALADAVGLEMKLKDKGKTDGEAKA